MFEYLPPEKALIMQVIMFFAVVGIFKTVELLSNRQFFTLGNLFVLTAIALAYKFFKH